jgi:hypothetical protein
MRTTNRRQYDTLERLLAQCEEKREALEAMPLGKSFLDQLRQSVGRAADCFKSQSSGRKAVHIASVARREAAVSVRRQANELQRTARVLGARSGIAMPLPALKEGSHRQLVVDTRSLLDTVAPLADVFKTHKIQVYDDLPAQITALDTAMKAKEGANGDRKGAGKALHDALKSGAEAVAGLDPLFLAVVRDNPEETAKWISQRRIGPARVAKDDVPAAATATVAAAPATDKAAAGKVA